MNIKKIIIVLILLSGGINHSYAYYSKEHKFYADFPSEPRIKCFEYTQEKTTVKVTSYQSVDKTGVYTVIVSNLNPPAIDDKFKDGFLEGALAGSLSEGGELLHKEFRKSPHRLLYVEKTKIRDTEFTISGILFFQTNSMVIDIHTMFPTSDIQNRTQYHTHFVNSVQFDN